MLRVKFSGLFALVMAFAFILGGQMQVKAAADALTLEGFQIGQTLQDAIKNAYDHGYTSLSIITPNAATEATLKEIITDEKIQLKQGNPFMDLKIDLPKDPAPVPDGATKAAENVIISIFDKYLAPVPGSGVKKDMLGKAADALIARGLPDNSKVEINKEGVATRLANIRYVPLTLTAVEPGKPTINLVFVAICKLSSYEDEKTRKKFPAYTLADMQPYILNMINLEGISPEFTATLDKNITEKYGSLRRDPIQAAPIFILHLNSGYILAERHDKTGAITGILLVEPSDIINYCNYWIGVEKKAKAEEEKAAKEAEAKAAPAEGKK